MDSHKEKSSDESTSVSDTKHLSKAKRSKKPNKRLVVLLVVLVVVVIGAVGGLLYYKKVQDDQKAKEAAAAAAAKAAANKPLTPEQQITKALTDGVQKQIDALKQDNPKALFDNDAAAAEAVGRNIDETP